MLKILFKPRSGVRRGDDLYAKAVSQARNPAFYTRLAVDDRIDARPAALLTSKERPDREVRISDAPSRPPPPPSRGGPIRGQRINLARPCRPPTPSLEAMR